MGVPDITHDILTLTSFSSMHLSLQGVYLKIFHHENTLLQWKTSPSSNSTVNIPTGSSWIERPRNLLFKLLSPQNFQPLPSQWHATTMGWWLTYLNGIKFKQKNCSIFSFSSFFFGFWGVDVTYSIYNTFSEIKRMPLSGKSASYVSPNSGLNGLQLLSLVLAYPETANAATCSILKRLPPCVKIPWIDVTVRIMYQRLKLWAKINYLPIVNINAI